MANFLVTGAAGFIGSAITRELLRRGENVRGFDDFSTGKPENIADLDGLDFRRASLLNADALASACDGVDYVIHQAALPSVPKSVAEPQLTHAVNINGTLNLLLAARDKKVKRVVYAASSSAYGETQALPKTEEMAPSPISPYAVQKLTGELYMQCFSRVYGLETVCLRYFNIFGPRQDAESQYSAVLAKFITQMLQGRTPTIYGDGEQSRDFTYVDNAVQANLLACTADKRASGQVFNIAMGARYSLNETYKMLQEIIQFPGPPKYEPERVGDVKHSLADISLAKKFLGYSPRVSFAEGLRHTVDWYKQLLEIERVAAASHSSSVAR